MDLTLVPSITTTNKGAIAELIDQMRPPPKDSNKSANNLLNSASSSIMNLENESFMLDLDNHILSQHVAKHSISPRVSPKINNSIAKEVIIQTKSFPI